MAAVLQMLLEGRISPQSVVSWLDGASLKNEILEESSLLQVEFVPVFLNFLRDQSNSILQTGSTNGLTPSKGSSSMRALKYVSPGKDPERKAHSRKHFSSSKAKTLKFLDTPVKNQNSSTTERTPTLDLDQLLQETDLPLTVSQKISPLSSSRNLKSSTPKGNSDEASTPYRHIPQNRNFASPSEFGKQEQYSYSKRQNFDGERGGYNVDKKHSVQKLSLGDFISTDPKRGVKKKSPAARDNNRTANSGTQPARQLPKTFDISDEATFPLVGCIPSQEKQPKRRINPTRITLSDSYPSKSTPFKQHSKALFGVPQGQPASSSFMMSKEGTKTLEEERELLRQERLKRQEKPSAESAKVSGRESPTGQTFHKHFDNEYVEAVPDRVTSQKCLDILAQVYSELILYNMVPSIMVELYYVIQLLTVRVITSEEILGNDKVLDSYLSSCHNCVYFATSVLLQVIELVKLLDRTAVRLLSENPRVQIFSEDLQKHLVSFLDAPPPIPFLNQQPKSPTLGGVSFQSDTDNRNNFPGDQAFHIFRKQRDTFYEIIRVWEENHMTPGWLYSQALGSRIRYLLSLRADPTNFVHFARLFQMQLLLMCHGEDIQFDEHQNPEDLGFLMLLKKQHPEKYKRLHERLVTPSKLGGPCPPPSFPGSQEFFKDFINTASHVTFNQHLKDVFISHILLLNEQDFSVAEPEEGDQLSNLTHSEARSVVLNLRLLAKFLGYLEFLPYHTANHMPENVLATHIELRSKVYPHINLNMAIRQCASSGQLVVGVTWIVEYLSMVDPVALHSKHYLTVVMTLIAMYKLMYVTKTNGSMGCSKCLTLTQSKNLSPTNSLLLKLLLGWLFDLPNFPDGLFFADVSEADIDQFEYKQNMQIINSNYSFFCVICLRNTLLPSPDDNDEEPQPFDSATPSKERKFKMPTHTPLKKGNTELSLSPLKTPSKYLAVNMIDTPETTPLKEIDAENETERVLYLDTSNFVDQQLITICCPFICELKNLLSDFLLGIGSSKSSGSSGCRRITPLSASDKESLGSSHKQLQLHLEDNFFHNQPSSVRKTTEFIVERISSNIIKSIRMAVIPQYREKALDRLKGIIHSHAHNNSSDVDCLKDIIRKHAVEISQEMCVGFNNHCSELSRQESSEKVKSTLILLLPSDVTSQEVEICQKLTCRSIDDKVSTWTQSHFTPALFSKDLVSDSERVLRQALKNSEGQNSTLQVSQGDMTISSLEISDTTALGAESSLIVNSSNVSTTDVFSPIHQPNHAVSGTKKSDNTETLPLTAKAHSPDVMSPSKVLRLTKSMVYSFTICPSNSLPEAQIASDVHGLLMNIQLIITARQDVTPAVYRALEALTVDLAAAIVSCAPAVMNTQNKADFISLWKPVDEGGVMPSPCGLKSFLGPRTVMLIAQNPSASHQQSAWKMLEEFTMCLLCANLITLSSLQEQCVSLLRHTWPEDILSGLSSCIKGIAETFQKQGKNSGDETLAELLEWVGWVCGEMEEFPDFP